MSNDDYSKKQAKREKDKRKVMAGRSPRRGCLSVCNKNA